MNDTKMKYIPYSLVMTVLLAAVVRSHAADVNALPEVLAESKWSVGWGKILSCLLQNDSSTCAIGAGENRMYPAYSRHNARHDTLSTSDGRGHRTTGAALVLLKKKLILKFYILAKLFIYGAIAKAKIALVIFKVLLFVALKFLALAVIHTGLAVFQFYYQYKSRNLYQKDMQQQNYGGWYGIGGQGYGTGYGSGDQNNGGWNGGGGTYGGVGTG